MDQRTHKPREHRPPIDRARKNQSAWAYQSQGTRLNKLRQLKDSKRLSIQQSNILDAQLGFPSIQSLHEEAEIPFQSLLGWLLHFKSSSIILDNAYEVSALEAYFIRQNGQGFKAFIVFRPYFYVRVSGSNVTRSRVSNYLQTQFAGSISNIRSVWREDLDLPNHLSGQKVFFLKLEFITVQELISVRSQLKTLIQNTHKIESHERNELDMEDFGFDNATSVGDSIEAFLIELREFDVPYDMRVAIDLELRVGAWYNISYDPKFPHQSHHIHKDTERVEKAEPIVCAFDIETTKKPLKFPDAENGDQVYMISYMIDRKGFLIVNRSFVSADIPHFEYTPKPSYAGKFQTHNVCNEKELLNCFLDHLKSVKPHIYVTFNGDAFDWPFLEIRCQKNGISLSSALGIYKKSNGAVNGKSGSAFEYSGRATVHLDAFCWVKRDSYLPQGSQGLKAVTKHKLGFDPVQVDAEDMLLLAQNSPMQMATYSVSDAVSTFYLYEKYVHLFIFSLCTIIPLSSQDVLRKGSGTLCEALLMAEAFRKNIICPNKSKISSQTTENFYKDTHLIENETYVGGHVECLASGVFRSDFEYAFAANPKAIDQLLLDLDSDLQSALLLECDITANEADVCVENYDQVKENLRRQLIAFRDASNTVRMEKPLIYHLDVSAMYPNIILTNRLEPCAIVTERQCAACVYHSTCNTQSAGEKSCQRELEWVWRGEYVPARKHEFLALKNQLAYEQFPSTNNELIAYNSLAKHTRDDILWKRLKSYCSNVYKRSKISTMETRKATLCMRENPFYVDTVRAFRDRRYLYKQLTKEYKNEWRRAQKSNDTLGMKHANDKALVYDSLQLAHKCILNSFYGYVMRKGARWHSMEMAGIVTHIGGQIIKYAREWMEQFGKPLELDTDGIWCMIPAAFPDAISFRIVNKENCVQTRSISYICAVLNAKMQKLFENPQYHEQNADGNWICRRECSISFEMDGPYHCMVLPASIEEGRLLKKRYAVFNLDKTLAELKGFELKRRGELELVKSFQSQVFDAFLHGNSLQECYQSVAQCANQWLDVLETRGASLCEAEILELVTERKTMSCNYLEYGDQKSTSLTTAKRLAEFLGREHCEGKGLTCEYIISAKPLHEKVTERAIPIAIFAVKDSAVKWHFLRKWCKDSELMSVRVCDILDWDYYWQRFGSTVQKIIAIPAASQQIENPVPRIRLPEWMQSKIRVMESTHKQITLETFWTPTKGTERSNEERIIETEMETEPMKTIAKLKRLGIDPFPEWLEQRKTQWKNTLSKRKVAMAQDTNAKRYNCGNSESNDFSMQKYVVRADITLDREPWHILEMYHEQDIGGPLICWVITSESKLLQRIELSVPRLLFLDVHVPTTQSEENRLKRFELCARRVRRTVLHTKKSGHAIGEMSLLEQTLSEERYQLYQKQWMPDIQSDPLIANVFETDVTPLLRAICAIGCVVSVGNKALKENSSLKRYSLNDLKFLSTETLSYLQNGADDEEHASIQRTLLFYSLRSRRGILALVKVLQTDDNCAIGEAQVFLIDPVSSAKMTRQTTMDMEHMLRDVYAKTEEKEAAKCIQQCTFQIHISSSVSEAVSNLNALLNQLHNEQFSLSKSPTVIIAQVPHSFTPQRLRSTFTGLHAFPLVLLPHLPSKEMKYSALTWRNDICRDFVRKLFQMELHFKHLLNCARYAHIPIGNFVGLSKGSSITDNALTVLDILYSRVLSAHNHLWWHSDSHASIEMHSSTTFSVYSQKGFYANVSVELQLEGLAVNAILKCSQVTALEMDFGDMTENAVAHTNLPMALESCYEAFRILKILVTSLLKDFIATQSQLTDHLLQNVYRWLCARHKSINYHPDLLNMVQLCMQKTLVQLLFEFKRLGAEAVYADAGNSKIILHIKKNTVKEASDHLNFVLETVLKQDLFRVLQLTPKKVREALVSFSFVRSECFAVQFVSQLLFMDIENYGAVEGNIQMDTDDHALKVVSHWNIAHHLSEGVDEYFLLIVAQFIRRLARAETLYQAKKERGEENDMSSEWRTQYLQQLMQSYFSTKLYAMTTEILDLGYNAVVNANSATKSPALDFVNSVCAVFIIETAISDQIFDLKRSLLKILNVSEFSDEAQFRNPSLSFVLPNVICSYCNACRSIDLCRDAQLLKLHSDATDEERNLQEMLEAAWSCTQCHLPYDIPEIEARLVSQIQLLSVSYQLQDPYCSRCFLPLEHSMKQYCDCSGQFQIENKHRCREKVLSDAWIDLHAALDILSSIAKTHGFLHLEQVCEALVV